MPDPTTDIPELSIEYPIALLPVRIETRFSLAESPAQLLIRVYPDEIVGETYDPLTDGEVAAGFAFWTEAWDEEHELDAWKRLATGRRPARAASIARVTTPTNIGSRPDGEPDWDGFTNPTTPGTPTVSTRVLPDCWVAIAYRNGDEIYRQVGNEIVEPLALSFTASNETSPPTLVEFNGIEIEDTLLWMLDFDEAVDAGMAMRMELTGTDVSSGFDRLVVVGVKAALEPDEAGERLAAILDGHHFGRGMALVRQGTPTNNSNDVPAGYPSVTEPEQSFTIERGESLVDSESDGGLLAKAFGVPLSVFAHVEGADRIEQQRAAAMTNALWPCTLGYFLEQMMSPLLAAGDISDIRQHAIDNVRGRGPLPVFRVGNVPYGVLPVTSLETYQAGNDTSLIEGKFRTLLKTWFDIYRAATYAVARVGRTEDPDADLLGVLALDASCREVRLREVVGPAFVKTVLRLFAKSTNFETSRSFIDGILEAAGIDGSPRVAGMTFDDTSLRVGRKLVTTDPLSELAPLSTNYITSIREAESITEIAGLGTSSTAPILLHLLRQAALVEYNRLALDQVSALTIARREVEFVHISPGTDSSGRATPWERFAANVAGTSIPVGDWLLRRPEEQDPPEEPDDRQIEAASFRASLEALENVPTSELERLTSETLDTCSHRLDAWITSLATRQLNAMRSVEDRDVGIHLGAFAFVEDLRPQTTARPGSQGGFIHAPSATHAATAAILRNGYLSRPTDARTELAIDLSSERVRRSLELLDGVRQGQPIGALLGYAFERALHELDLDQYIAAFRKKFPLSRDPSGSTEAEGERIAARDVVNGLALRDAIFESPSIPWGDDALPTVADGPHRQGVEACLQRLEDDVDSIADLLIAESVYQIVQGNTDRTAANLASLAGNGTIPTPGVISVPRSGTNFTHRVAVVLGGTSSETDWATDTPRGIAEPRLDAWMRTLFGPADNIQCVVRHPDPETPEETIETTVSIVDLELGALDVYEIAQRTGAMAGSELDARVRWFARDLEPTEVVYVRPAETPLSVLVFDEAVEVARIIREHLGGARPLTASDVYPPHEIPSGTEESIASRVSSTNAAFGAARDALDAAVEDATGESPPETFDDLRDALWDVTRFGVSDAVPVSLFGETAALRSALLAQAQKAQTELTQRSTAYAALATEATNTERLNTLLGPSLLVLQPFAPTNQETLATSIGESPISAEPMTVRVWFDRLARVRPAVDRMRIAAHTTRATAGADLNLKVAQLPHIDEAMWIGGEMPRASTDPRPPAGTLSLVMNQFEADALETGTWAGLVVDEWVEQVPAATQQTAVALHHDAPGAEAPQCIVLAVPAPTATAWSLNTVIEIVNQTLDLAKVRGVDSDRLGQFSLLAPCIYLAANVEDEAITSRLGSARINENSVSAPE